MFVTRPVGYVTVPHPSPPGAGMHGAWRNRTGLGRHSGACTCILHRLHPRPAVSFDVVCRGGVGRVVDRTGSVSEGGEVALHEHASTFRSTLRQLNAISTHTKK